VRKEKSPKRILLRHTRGVGGWGAGGNFGKGEKYKGKVGVGGVRSLMKKRCTEACRQKAKIIPGKGFWEGGGYLLEKNTGGGWFLGKAVYQGFWGEQQRKNCLGGG